ncbi:hypothetical protein NDU88_006323 [Pleurodeles waltl]|uniref:Uncharacterized protein n=1 Tax=Pleurodeles waltl TaxID=8319 RepID=A0AAV7L5I4_PLEWA|nr:hypothetical protein NDU88_006323 [Pleurodeles waltl]
MSPEPNTQAPSVLQISSTHYGIVIGQRRRQSLQPSLLCLVDIHEETDPSDFTSRAHSSHPKCASQTSTEESAPSDFTCPTSLQPSQLCLVDIHRGDRSSLQPSLLCLVDTHEETLLQSLPVDLTPDIPTVPRRHPPRRPELTPAIPTVPRRHPPRRPELTPAIPTVPRRHPPRRPELTPAISTVPRRHPPRRPELTPAIPTVPRRHPRGDAPSDFTCPTSLQPSQLCLVDIHRGDRSSLQPSLLCLVDIHRGDRSSLQPSLLCLVDIHRGDRSSLQPSLLCLVDTHEETLLQSLPVDLTPDIPTVPRRHPPRRPELTPAIPTVPRRHPPRRPELTPAISTVPRRHPPRRPELTPAISTVPRRHPRGDQSSLQPSQMCLVDIHRGDRSESLSGNISVVASTFSFSLAATPSVSEQRKHASKVSSDSIEDQPLKKEGKICKISVDLVDDITVIDLVDVCKTIDNKIFLIEGDNQSSTILILLMLDPSTPTLLRKEPDPSMATLPAPTML